MKEILDKLDAIATTLSAVEKDLESVEVPSKKLTDLVAQRIEEVQNQYNNAIRSLIDKQRMFLDALLRLTYRTGARHRLVTKPEYRERTDVGKYILVYYSHQWTRWAGQDKCVKLIFGTGEASTAFKEICNILIQGVLSFPESIPLADLQVAAATLVELQTSLKPTLTEARP
jgi:hypothetical protein